MSRYVSANKSGAAPASGTNLFNVRMTTATHCKIRKIVFGFEGATTPSQVCIGLFTSTAGGTETSPTAPLAEDTQAPAAVSTVATAWSGAITLAGTPIIRRTFDVLAESEWVLELPDELDTGLGNATASSAKGLAAQVLDNNVASGVTITWSVFIDE